MGPVGFEPTTSRVLLLQDPEPGVGIPYKRDIIAIANNNFKLSYLLPGYCKFYLSLL